MAEDEGTADDGQMLASDASAADEAADWLAAARLSDADDQGDASPALPDAEDTIEPMKEEDPELWKPHPPTEECPVCLVPLPLQTGRVNYWPCCGMLVCQACIAETERALFMKNREREAKEEPPMDRSCAFCTVPAPYNNSEMIKRFEARVGKGDVKAMLVLAGLYSDGIGEHPPSDAKALELLRKAADKGDLQAMMLAGYYEDGELGIVRNEAKALELCHRAADLGPPDGLHRLGSIFLMGQLGVTQNKEKARTYWEDAAKKGDVDSRYNLGEVEAKSQRHDLAIRHFKLAATAGCKDSMKEIWKYFPSDKLDKAELEATLRAHHAACDEMNSEERKRYEAWQEALAGNDDTLKEIYEHYYDGFMTAKELKKALRSHGSKNFEELRAQMELIERKYGEYIDRNT